MARLVILDPELLSGCPRKVIAESGMDALTQAIEAYTSRHATGLTDTLALRAIELIAGALAPTHRDPACEEAEDLLQGSYLAGLALSHARLGIAHGLAHPLGARFHVSHGLACAACLPVALSFNRSAMAGKYDRMAEVLGMDPSRFVLKLFKTMGLKSPFYGRRLSDVNTAIEEVLASGSTKANPRDVGEADVRMLLRDILGATAI